MKLTLNSGKTLGNLLLLLLFTMNQCTTPAPTYTSYDEYPVYTGDDLGLSYTAQSSTFKVWSPAAQALKIHIYKDDQTNQKETHNLKRGDQGVWTLTLTGDHQGKYYTFQTKHDENWLLEAPDSYAKAVGTNGNRAMIIDLGKTNPEGWLTEAKPAFNNKTDAIIYELHVRDFSIHPESGIQQKGKFLGLTETGTKSPDGTVTGLDHVKELGITHLHLLPVYDFMSVDESRLSEPQFNWGYDPHNYNIPEGSYSTNPADGTVRIREFKEMVKALHENGIRVIMDVVYNHTGLTDESHFNQIVPGYYYRQNPDSTFSNASGCGNETASNRPMVRKFMVESVKYWVQQYHVDGFRFDLMGIHDIETMNEISQALHEIDPTILIYGEGWTAGDSPLPEEKRALKKHTQQLDRIAAFSDDMRDGLKGSVFEHEDRGFASAKKGQKESIKFGIVAATEHPQIDYPAVNYSNEPWAAEPFQCINYASCHDNHTLYDRLVNSVKEGDEATRVKMHRLTNAIVLTSQGIPFLHAGAEFLRTKDGEENAYKSPDAINQLDWERKAQKSGTVNYYQDLIRLRKAHPAFRMPNKKLIQEHLQFLESPELVIAYTLNGAAVEDSWKKIVVLLNGNTTPIRYQLPKGNWTLYLDGDHYDEKGIRVVKSKTIAIPASTAYVLGEM